MLLRYQNLISSFKAFPIVSFQKIEKMSEAYVRQKLLCAYPTMQLKPHILYKPLSQKMALHSEWLDLSIQS